MAASTISRAMAFFVLVVFAAPPASADITSTTLRIQGAGLRVVTEAVTTSVDLPATVQTEFGGKQNDDAIAIEGVTAVGELTGPGIDTPIQLTTAPGHRFQIPALAQQGVYLLQNVRLMKGAEFLQQAVPSASIITVADLLQTSVTVKQLSPDELRRRGITVDPRNFDVYEYSFSFLIDGRTVVVPFPVIVDPRTHEVQPVRSEMPYALPPQGLTAPPRWTPPQIIAMEFADETELPQPGEEPKERTSRGTRASIPAAIVIPNGLAVLHQFFAVAVMVTNGAPEGSAARLEDIKATIRIPTALRTVKTQPQVSFGTAVPIVEPTTGVSFLVAGSRGEAEWTLEGLEPGTHRIDFDLRATLKQDGQIDTPMRATPSAAIVVHDPRFNITFSHPDTVRKGIEYSTYSFITNMSASEQTIAVTSGVESCDANPSANVCRITGTLSDTLTIPAGDMRIIEYRLRAGTTGRVFATAGTVGGDALTASVRLQQGVSESGIPLSPATLLLPHYAQYVAPQVVSANLQLLGLGYSLATAPLNAMTAKFPRVIRTDVFQRAVDLARAGQRIFITDGNVNEKRDAIAHLALDVLGNGGYELREWDELRRQESSGRTAGAAVFHELEASGLANGASAAAFMDAFANATAHRAPFVAALTTNNATIALKARTSGRRTEHPNEASSWMREIPYADLSRFGDGELALVGRWTEDLDVYVSGSGAYTLDLLYPDFEDGRLKRAHLELTGDATITITRGATSLTPAGVITTIEPAPLRINGARQDLHLDEDGHKVSVLFNRPITVPPSTDLRTLFEGTIAFHRDNVVYNGSRPISAAALQDDGRTVNVTFDHTLSQNATYAIHTALAGDVTPKIDNDAPAGIVSGRVVKGDNTPIGGVDVTLRQYLPNDGSIDPQGTPQYDVSQADGAFFFEYVRRQIDAGWTGTYRLAALSSVHGTTSIEGAVRQPGEVRFVALQYLGRGAAEGTVKYNDGTVVANAFVTVGSTMFSQLRTARTDASGSYRVDDLPVGPLTFSAQDASGNVTFAANEVATPGQLVTQNLSIFRQPFPGLGKVHGVVRRSDTNAPMAGVHVGVYSQGYGLTDGFTDSEGRFTFDKVPAGFVSVLAEEWTIARQSVAVDLDLKANETREANLLFIIAPQPKFVTLTGEVWRENPLQPGASERVAGALVKIAGYRVVTADSQGRFTYEELPLGFSGKNITAFDPATQRVKTTVVPTLTEAGPNSVALFINAFDRGSGKIRVHLVNSSGAPVAGYRVLVPGFPPDVLQSVGAGVYELNDVPVGSTREIWAVPNGLRPDSGADPRPYGDQSAHGSARVDFNGHIAALTLRLPGQGTVRVKVRSQLDLIAPVSLTYPVWFEGDQGLAPFTLEASTEKNGEADRATFINIPAQTSYTVSSAHPQYGYAAATSQLAYDGALNEHTLQLNTLATVRGTVYAIDGITPVAGATVTIANGRSDPGSRFTGPDGRFEFFDQPANTNVTVTAQITQSEIYRTGFSSARTPANGGAVENLSVVLRKRGFVDGRVVYRDYKRFDPANPANNLADDTPNDLSDNAPVPLANFYLRELDFPYRNFGTASAPMRADVTGRFVLNHVFTGSLRATGWDPSNEELRGDWTGRIDEEGQEAAPKAYIAVTSGFGGIGSARVTVVDPNQSYAQVPNAEVSVYANGRAFDFGSTDPTGSVQFDGLPSGTYSVSAYSKALGKSSRAEGVFVPRDGTGSARLELEFSGTVDGTLEDPEAGNAPVPGSHVRLTAASYQTQSTTDANGFFLFQGVREGAFALDAKDTRTNRRAHANRELTVLDPHRTVRLLLEPTESLHFAAYLPDDFGNRSAVLAPPLRAEATQRCWYDSFLNRHCDYERQSSGNPLVFDGALEQAGYEVHLWQAGDVAPSIHLAGAFPTGTAANPLIYVHPAYGEVRVTVTQGGAPANGAKVRVYGANANVTVYTDSTGQAIARNVRLGEVYVQAESVDGRFSGSARFALQRQSVPATTTIALGTFAGVTGSVEAEAGGPSIGTRVVAHFSNVTAEVRTDSDGRYTFLGIPTQGSGATSVTLVFIGPDDSTTGGSLTTSVRAGDGTISVATVKLDATPPQLVSILPADGAIDVSPDANITVTFSERIAPGTIHGSSFQLVDPDSGTIATTLTSTALAGGRFTVTLKPNVLPLRSNALYRVIVTSAVTDLTGHALPSTRGFTFTTSDYAEPRVLKVLPANPIPAATTFEFRFNEPIDPTPWQPNGGATFRVEKLLAPGGANAAVERQLIARAFVDPTNMTLFIAPDESNPIQPESFYRVRFSGVRDAQGNALGEQIHHFFSFDEVAPQVVFTAPPQGEQLVSGAEYEVRVSVPSDVKKVDYFFVAANGTETPFATITQAPFSVRFLGPEAPAAGTTVTVGAQATDTSGNRGAKATISWTVKPNAAPANVVVTPQQASAYPSRTIGAAVTFSDEGTFASITATVSIPKNNGTIETTNVTRSYTRLANGTWPLALFERTLPSDAKAGERVTITATVTDVRGLTSAPASATIDIAEDLIEPNIVSLTPAANTTFTNNAKFTIEAVVTDAESGVQSVEFYVDGNKYAVASQSGSTYRSAPITVRAKADDARIAIAVTARDFHGNTRSKSHEVNYTGVHDPDAPRVAWLCPIDKAALPANAASFALKLRVNVVDEDVRAVRFRIGETTLVDAALVSGTQYGATYTFTQTPSVGSLTITAIVEDTVAAHTVELPIAIELIQPDFTFVDPKAITASDVATFTDKTIALIGSGAVLAPQVPLTLRNLLVLQGARVETLPATITREFRVDITTSGTTYVDCDSSIDVSGRGYAGGWEQTTDGRNDDARGRTVNNTPSVTPANAAPSHGGVGGLDRNTSTYGSLTAPTALGTGGNGSAQGALGQRGGGAIALHGGNVVVAGTLAANGTHGTFNFAFPGTGGSIWLDAHQVLLGGNASLSATGGDDDFFGMVPGGAGGGRIAIAAGVKLDAGDAKVIAHGGYHHGMFDFDAFAGNAGAGTVFLRRPGQEHGELTVSALDPRYANTAHYSAPTPLGSTTGALAFDRITAGPRALVVFDVPFTATETSVDPTAVIVPFDNHPTLDLTTTPAAGATLIRDTTLAASYTASSIAGVSSVQLTWSPETTPRTNTFELQPTTTPQRSHTLTVPATTPLGNATLQIAITDRAGRTHAMTPRTFTIIDNAEPVIASFTIAPANSIHAGRDVLATVVTSDDVAVKSVTFEARLNGTLAKTETFTPNAKNATSIFTVPVANDVAGGSTLTIEVRVSDNFPNRAARTAQQTVTILSDTNAPSVTITSPAPNATYVESSTIPVRVTATDAEVAVREVTARFDGGTPVALTLTSNEWRADLTAPAVDGSQNAQRTLTIAASDFASNTTTAPAIPLTIQPIVDPNAPTITWTCGTTGAMFAAGLPAKLRVTAIAANAQNPVQTVALFIDDSTTTLAATSIGSNQYEVTYNVPANTADGQAIRVRAVATAAGGASSDTIATFTVAATNLSILSAATTIETTNTTHENKTVVVTAGAILIRGPHTFDRLLILGGSVAHVAAERLELTVTRNTYVACDGAIDAGSRGYTNVTGYPGTTHATSQTGASHIGIGGIWNGNGSTFGSIAQPQELGGGNGTSGGGVIRLRAQSLHADGPIRANGGDGGGGNGAGGSIWITTDRVSGRGPIEANGGTNPTCCTFSAGGGGAVSLELTDATSTLPTLNARGGTSANGRHAAAGTVVVRGPSSTYGDLTIDNAGVTAGTFVEPPSLGTGRVLSTSGATFVTDRAADIPSYFTGHRVDLFAPSGTRRGTWRISAVSGKSITLLPNASETIPVAAGDAWRGVYLFDTVKLRSSKVQLLDDLRGTRDLDASSALTVNDPPSLNASLISTQSLPTGDGVRGNIGAVTDAQPPVTLTATNVRTGATFTTNAAADGSFSIPVAGESGDTFTLIAADAYTLRATSPRLTVTGALQNLDAVTSVSTQPSLVISGATAIGQLRTRYPIARASGATIALTSSDARVVVPASVLVTTGTSTAAFPITTTSVAIETTATITATLNGSTQSATITLLPVTSTLTQLALDTTTAIGGTTLNATLTLGAPAPLSGATVTLASSHPSLATVPPSITIAAGAMTATFPVTTYALDSTAAFSITATYGATLTRNATLTKCTTLGSVAPPASIALDTTWLDDTIPAGATLTSGTIDTTRAASGTSAIHFSGDAIATFALTNTSLVVRPNDRLSFYALVNPCDPPRQLLATLKTATSEWRASWGESRIEPRTRHTIVTGLPRNAQWTRLEVLAKTLGITSNTTLTSLSIRSEGGEAWVDALGLNACSSSVAQTPAADANEVVGTDELRNVPVQTGEHESFVNADPLPVGRGDLLFAWVYVDPCNPPRQLMLTWFDGASSEHRAFWGDSLIARGTEGFTSRARIAPLPAGGQWVRLELPAALTDMENRAVSRITMTLVDGQAWLGRTGRMQRVNLARGRTATQSSTLNNDAIYAASGAVDGSLTNFSHTASTLQPYWQADLGAKVAIDTIQIHNRSDCCADRLSNFWVLLSDAPLPAGLDAARAQATIALRHYSWQAMPLFQVPVSARYVRVQLEGTNSLHMREVEIWAPVTYRENLAVGRVASQSSDFSPVYVAAHGVDGLANTHVSHTLLDPHPSWQVDLGEVRDIATISFFKRVDCCQNEPRDFYLFVSDDAMSGSATELLAKPGVKAYFYPTVPVIAELPVYQRGRYVRLHVIDPWYMLLTELQVWGLMP